MRLRDVFQTMGERNFERRLPTNTKRRRKLDPVKALAEYRKRGSRSLRDQALESNLFAQLGHLEEMVDCIGPTTLRRALSEQVVQMRATICAFDQESES